ncbi:alpha/beta hydrolase [Sphaerisporangium sp. NPDC051017]|uniref:alpha/beta hydrolase n=1 Tax=Sphaerisporangium sp. NPDC051017 TaxID=3154636 RepID=UPI003447D350
MATGQAAELEAALSRVIRLADEHARALDPPMRCIAASAWVGGGAPAFSKALNDQRTTMQQAFQEAAEQISARIRHLGGQAPQVPSFSTSVSVMSAPRTGFSGMDVTAMEGLVADLRRAAEKLPEAGHRLSAELSALCVPASSGSRVAGAGEWAQGQVGDLRRRLSMIQEEHDPGLTTKAMAGFGLFGGYAPDPGGVSKLITAAGNGDAEALKALLALQNTGKDATLANRLSAWWHQLGKPAQERLINQSPQLIGSLNGLPAATRDQANRKYLTAEKSWLASELARVSALPVFNPMLAAVRKAKIEEVQLKMRQLTSVEQALARGGQNGLPQTYLLQIELGGLGKTAISFGNPDDADNIVAYVPGTGTKLEGSKGDAKRASDMWARAHVFDPDMKIASIAWLGYAAPQWGDAGPLHTPATLDDARAGAPLLASFADGLHAAHQAASDARFTVLGHSYGSTVTGVAAQMRPKSFADQLIFVGSPGVVAEHAKDLGVDSVWVGEAPNDPVGDIGSLGPVNRISDPPGVLSALVSGAISGVGPFGSDPSRSKFGAKRFYVPDSGDSLLSFRGHSSYWGKDERGWDQRSTSLWNIGRLITGQYDELIPFPEPSPRSTPSPTAPPPAVAQSKLTEEPTSQPVPSPRPAGG